MPPIRSKFDSLYIARNSGETREHSSQKQFGFVESFCSLEIFKKFNSKIVLKYILPNHWLQWFPLLEFINHKSETQNDELLSPYNPLFLQNFVGENFKVSWLTLHNFQVWLFNPLIWSYNSGLVRPATIKYFSILFGT